MNTAAEHLLGMGRRLARGTRMGDGHPGLDEVLALVDKARERGRGYSGDVQLLRLQAQGRASVDDPVRANCTVTPTRDGGVIVELSDATRRRQLDRENALRTQHGASRRITRQLAHEIRNPLGGLRGAAQLLESELPHPSLKEYTRIIIGEADRLAGLMDSLLGPRRVLAQLAVNVHEILEHVAGLVEGESGLQVARDYDPSLPPLLLDRHQIIQAVLNLARNASQAAGMQGRVLFRTRALTNQALGEVQHRVVASLEIEDDGPGVPRDIEDSIFYPLVTGKESGTGLGLPLAQDIVSRHGGQIEFNSRPGCTVFMVRLPVIPGEVETGP